MINIISLALSIVFLFSISSHAQTKVKKQRAEFDSTKVVEVRFANPNWNKDPLNIDNGVVMLRDSKSNKTIQVLLEETAPDASVFSGTYSISWGGDQSIKPEVYVLNQSQLMNESQLKQTLADISSGKLKRKPLFYKKTKWVYKL